jgi:hypothetical protein
MSRRKPLPTLQPIYVRPHLDRRQRAAMRAWRDAAYSGKRNRPARGTFDPLELRAGMRANNIESRAGWVVSNPLYDQTLVRNPSLDPSLPGPGWLWEVYRSHRSRELVMLPRTLAVVEARTAAARPAPAEPTTEAAPAVDQLELFHG